MGETAKKKMNGKKFRRIMIPIISLLLIINLLATVAMNIASSTLDTYLGKGKVTRNSIENTSSWDTDYYNLKYSDSNEARDAAYKVADKVMEEGTVLLKNNGVLPLEKGSTVTPFGRGYLEPIYGQLDSHGSAKWVIDPITPEQGLLESYNINYSAVDKMKATENPVGLKESLGTTAAGTVDSPLGGNSFIYEYDPIIYEQIESDPESTGIVFITRAGQEGSDKKYDAYEDGTSHYLALSENEKNTIKSAKEKCGDVIVVLVSSAPMELTPIMEGEYEADSILWVGHPGERGFSFLAKVMDGEVNPSGRTVDTYASDFTKDPSYQNIGSFQYNNSTAVSYGYGTSGEFNRYYTDYQEDVYMGYRYYETAHDIDDTFVYGELDNMGGVKAPGAVCYPFGYGLSYTTFEQEITSYKDDGKNIIVEVKVTNKGDIYSGKEVVQLYYNAPYTDLDKEYKIEKPTANLAAFSKTEELKPGESQLVKLTIAKEDMASYSYTHENSDGTTGCYMLEQGDYTISLRSNSHDIIDSRTTHIDSTIWYDGSDQEHIRQSDIDAQSSLDDKGNSLGYAKGSKTDKDITYIAATNKFQTSSDYMNTDSSILSRANWQSTFPKTVEGRSKSISEKYIDELGLESEFDVETDPTYGNVPGSVVYMEEQPESFQNNKLTLSDMRGKDYNDTEWDLFLNQIDWNDDKDGILLNFIGAAYTLGEIKSLGIPETVQVDGANGIKVQGSDMGYDMKKSSSLPFAPVMAATWNRDILYEVGAAFGAEAIQHGITGWYSPAINLHRSPFSGRVFEYYSEDPLLSGKLGAAVISGAGDQGLVCYIKHFGLNETETNRANLANTWATEQAMREVYLKPFEIAIKEAKMTVKYTADDEGNTETKVMRAATAVMPAQNAVGTIMGSCNYALLNDLLRDEWGFEGMVITDYWVWSKNSIRDLSLRTGSDAYLCNNIPVMWNLDDYTSPTARWSMRNSIHNIAYTLANSNVMQNASPGTTFNTSMAMWKMIAISVNTLIYLLVLVMIVGIVLRSKDEKKNPDNYKIRKIKNKNNLGIIKRG